MVGDLEASQPYLSIRPAIVEVVWSDPCVEPVDNLLLEKAELGDIPLLSAQSALSLRSTVGYVLWKNTDELCLRADLYADQKQDTSTPMIIPWKSVINWWEFEVH